jgi:cobalamin synthase
MNTARRKLILGFSIFLGVMLAAATAVVAYIAYQMQTARFGDIFDRVVSQQTQTWVVPILIAIAGVSVIGLLLFVGFYMFLDKDSPNV